MGILTYVAGMTDQFAVDTYRNFKGIQLPNY
jgi:dGTP triphosphohydrolase